MAFINIDQGVYEYLRSERAKLLDIRTPAEYIQGHIPGSMNVPLHTIDDVEFLVENKEDPLYVYCYSGARCYQAVNQLQEMGFQNVKNIGGIAAYSGKIIM